MNPISLINFIISVLTFLILSGLLIYLAWKLAKKREKFNKIKLIGVLRVLFFIYFIAFLLYRTGLSYTDNYYQYQSNFLGKFFELLFNLEAFFNQAVSGFFNFFPSNQVSTLVNLYLPSFILIFLTILSFWRIIQKKKFMFLSIAFIAYALSLFFIKPESFFVNVKFEVPAINISEIIEKRETGIFYNPIKFFNSREGKLFRYLGNFKNGEFIIQNNVGKAFFLNPDKLDKNLNKNTFKELITKIESSTYDEKLRGEYNPNSKINEIMWPTDFHCKNQVPLENMQLEDKEYIKISDVFNSEICLRLLYKNDIVISNSLINVVDLDFSKDKKWMILVLNEDFSNTADVYLVKLPN